MIFVLNDNFLSLDTLPVKLTETHIYNYLI